MIDILPLRFCSPRITRTLTMKIFLFLFLGVFQHCRARTRLKRCLPCSAPPFHDTFFISIFWNPFADHNHSAGCLWLSSTARRRAPFTSVSRN
ncbi:hypothetical protein DFH06DRAFT_1182122 [Mycena polygramma]|nr:hypothetical protein DFH06DRAFT_1182122 [Mycena polygramma]